MTTFTTHYARLGRRAIWCRAVLMLLGGALFCTLAAPAEMRSQGIPRILSYQGLLTDDQGIAQQGLFDHELIFRIYDREQAGVPLWEEKQTVSAFNGTFDTYFGLNDQNPLSIPFDTQYWVEVVDVLSGIVFAPRTRMVASPYSIRSDIANDLDPSARVVRSLNGQIGDVTLEGSGGIAINVDPLTGNLVVTGSGGGGGMDTLKEGSIWYGDPQNRHRELPIGMPNQVLTVNAAGTAPEWSSEMTIDSLTVNGGAVIGISGATTTMRGRVVFVEPPVIPLPENHIWVGNAEGVQEAVPPGTEGQVLQIDSDGSPKWTSLSPGLTGGRVPTEGKLIQKITEAAVTANAKIMVEYEDPTSGAMIPVKVIARAAGSEFTVQFTALPPAGTFVTYIILP